VKPVAEVPPFIGEFAEDRLKERADCVSCMFAIHYFFESPEKLQGLLRNIADTLKVGGYFIGCCFDGESVFNALAGVEKGKSIIGKEGTQELWRITKDYEADEMPPGEEGFGMAVNVFFKTIGAEHREYLVPFKLLEDSMRRVGCELLSMDELREVGLVNSTAMFRASYEMAERNGQKFAMGAAARQFAGHLRPISGSS
jgi:mRNA (guanine-N7-)-methyltransferase